MPDIQKQNHADFSRFDRMSTEELKEILYRDSLLPESDETGMDTILYIMEVVARREKESPDCTIPDADEAFASFHKNYAPLADTGRSLYDFDDSNQEETAASDETSFQNKASSRENRKPKVLHKISLIAAVFVCVLLIGSVSSLAMGFNLWGAVRKWTSDVFGFSPQESLISRNIQQDEDIPEQLGELYDQMHSNKVLSSVLPSWIPEGYEMIETNTDATSEYTDFHCILINKKTNEYLIFHYRLHQTDSDILVFEKNDEAPEVYRKNGIEYGIMENMDTYRMVWSVDNLECSIAGFNSRAEAIQVIDSIGE